MPQGQDACTQPKQLIYIAVAKIALYILSADQLRDEFECSWRRESAAFARHLKGCGKHFSFGHINSRHVMNLVGKVAPLLPTNLAHSLLDQTRPQPE